MGVMKPEKLCQITIVVKDLERVAKLCGAAGRGSTADVGFFSL